ncbi:hypothetical protein, partial [Pseudomonas aeruginosa]|uniref:hypothetical protein n=1 Tax=Pseudomonas aeruginosa TaxID=287 RepID=UPI003981CBEA
NWHPALPPTTPPPPPLQPTRTPPARPGTPDDDLRRAPGSFAERARRAWAEHLGGGAGRSRLLAEAALGLSGDDLLAAQARLLEARGGWWVLSSRR